MGKYLISTCETYRVDSESAAKQIIEEAKHNKNFSLLKYTSEYKERKAKGEVIDAFYKITLTKVFNDIKEPDSIIDINYNVDAGAFPDPVKKTEDEEAREDEEPGDMF